MSDKPYAPPQASVGVPGEVQGAPVKAVLYGLLVDIGGTIMITTVMSMMYGLMLLRTDLSQAEIERMLMNLDPFSTYGLLMSGAGLLCSFWGGYVCALYSRQHILRDTAVLATLSVIVGVLLSGDTYTSLQHLLLAALGIAAIFSGALLWRHLHR